MRESVRPINIQGEKQHRKHVMGPIRLIGRILEKYRIITNTKATSTDMIKGENWSGIKKAVLQMSNNNQDKINLNTTQVHKTLDTVPQRVYKKKPPCHEQKKSPCLPSALQGKKNRPEELGIITDQAIEITFVTNTFST
jgi:hypothetical protein